MQPRKCFCIFDSLTIFSFVSRKLFFTTHPWPKQLTYINKEQRKELLNQRLGHSNRSEIITKERNRLIKGFNSCSSLNFPPILSWYFPLRENRKNKGFSSLNEWICQLRKVGGTKKSQKKLEAICQKHTGLRFSWLLVVFQPLPSVFCLLTSENLWTWVNSGILEEGQAMASDHWGKVCWKLEEIFKV